MKKSFGESAFDLFNIILLLVICFTMLYPFINILAISLNDAKDSQLGGIYFLPRKFTLASYMLVFKTPSLLTATFVSLSRTLVGTIATVFCSAMFAYTFTKPGYLLYKPMKFIFFAAVFFGGGGLIPTYLLFQKAGLVDKFIVYILPGLINLFFVIILRSYYLQLPYGLSESAMLDGANDLVIFFRIIFPLSMPIIAFVALNVAVGQWNAWQDTLFFTKSNGLKTLQYIMMEVILRAEARAVVTRAAMNLRKAGIASTVDPKSVRMAITIVVTLPIVFTYPFLQKYFIKGILIGSMKG